MNRCPHCGAPRVPGTLGHAGTIAANLTARSAWGADDTPARDRLTRARIRQVTVDPWNNPEPVWAQVTADLRSQITAGLITGRLPSERAIADRYAVSRKTARRALRQLAAEQLAELRPGTGYHVTGRGV